MPTVTTVDGKQTVTYTLADNAVWSDGEPITSADFKYTSDQVKEAVTQGYEWLSGLTELRDVTYVDVPTSHWPMWSRPHELAEIIGNVADAHRAS